MSTEPKALKLGYCAFCDEEIWFFSNNKPKYPNEKYREIKFELDNGSGMRVAFCDKCFPFVEEKDFDRVMTAVILGWEDEVFVKVQIGKWTKEQAEDYRKNFYQLKIKDFWRS